MKILWRRSLNENVVNPFRDVRFYQFIVCSHVSRCACGVWWACDVMRNVCLLVGPSQGVNPAKQGTFVHVCVCARVCACVQLSFPNVLGYEEIQVHDSNQTQHLSCCYLSVSLSFALIHIFSLDLRTPIVVFHPVLASVALSPFSCLFVTHTQQARMLMAYFNWTSFFIFTYRLAWSHLRIFHNCTTQKCHRVESSGLNYLFSSHAFDVNPGEEYNLYIQPTARAVNMAAHKIKGLPAKQAAAFDTCTFKLEMIKIPTNCEELKAKM